MQSTHPLGQTLEESGSLSILGPESHLLIVSSTQLQQSLLVFTRGVILGKERGKGDPKHSLGSSWTRRGGRTLTPVPLLLLPTEAQAPNSAWLVAIQQPALWERQEGTSLWCVLFVTFPVVEILPNDNNWLLY